MNPFAWSGLLTALSSAGLGLLVLIRCPDRRLAWRWYLFANSVAAYGFGAMRFGISQSPTECLFWFKVSYTFGVIWIPILFFHFVLVFRRARNLFAVWIQYGIGILCLLLLLTDQLFALPKLMFHSVYFAQAGKLYPYYVIWWGSLVIFSHARLLYGWKALERQEQNQIKYFMLATAIGFTGGSMSYLPSFDINIYPWGNFAIVLYPIIMSYAILKHRLMDIDIVIRKTLLYSVVSAILAAIYVGIITLAAQGFGMGRGAASALSPAVAAVFITLLFNPLRIRTQRWIDRQFPRERLDPELVREAAGGMAHEMKRPLSKITLPVEMALTDLARAKSGETTWEEILPEVEERLAYVINQSVDAGYLIEAILELSSNQRSPEVPVDLASALLHAIEAEKALIKKYGISIEHRIAADLPPIRGRTKQIEIVFANIVKNAVEAMSGEEDGGERIITIEGRKEGSRVVVEVKDSGPGIAETDRERIFEPRYSTKGPLGVGIGLSLCRQILEACGGTIQAGANNGNGAVLILSFTPVKS